MWMNEVVVVLSCVIMFTTRTAQGISCYVCSSHNGSDISCEDPYHPAWSTYAENCQVPKVNHVGMFPANFCVKITGVSNKKNERLMIRTCVLENMDSQCGVFQFEDDKLTGCILTCEYNGCNEANRLWKPFFLYFFSVFCVVMASVCW